MFPSSFHIGYKILVHWLVAVWMVLFFWPKTAAATSPDSVRTWDFVVNPSLKVNQRYFDNWSADGNSLVSFTASFVGKAKYTHPLFIWDNDINTAFGISWQNLDAERGLESRRKSDDRIDATSTLSMRLKNKWNINATANLKSQYWDGYKYAAPDTTLLSSFFAPAYLTTAIGFEYKREFWNVSYSFITGKTTFVTNERVIEAGQLYGVDTAGGRRIQPAIGSYFKFYFMKDVRPKLNLYFRSEFFYDYNKPGMLTKAGRMPESRKTAWQKFGYSLIHETDIDLETTLAYRFSNNMSLSFSCRLKYDTDFMKDGEVSQGKFGSWQVYQWAGLEIYMNWKKTASHTI